LLLGLGGFTAVVMRRRHAKPLLPHERALMRLEQAQPLALAGQVREYAGAASDAVREYIEERFLLRAAHLTTEEFFENLVAHEDSSLASHRESCFSSSGPATWRSLLACPLARERMVSLNDLAPNSCSIRRRTRPKPNPHLRGRHEPLPTSANLVGTRALAVARAVAGTKRARPAVTFSNIETARDVARATRSRWGRFLGIARWIGLALLIVGLARPQLGHASTEVQASGIDLVLAVDISGSMQALDLTEGGEPSSRLDVVKSVVAQFIKNRPNDRIALVAFSAEPYLMSPLTLDHDWLLQNLVGCNRA